MSTTSSIVPSPSTPTPSPKSRIVQSPSTVPFSSSHTTTSNYPHFSQFKASHLLSKAYLNHHINNNSSINSANSHLQTHLNSKLLLNQKENNSNTTSAESNTDSSSSNSNIASSSSSSSKAIVHHQRVIDPDEQPINPFTISGFFYKTLIVIISILPLVFVEKLLTLFAWIQIELLKAKKGSDNNRASLKKKRKAKKKKSKVSNTNNTLVNSIIHKVPSSSNFKHIRRLSYSGSGLPHYKPHLIGHSNLNPNFKNETPSLPPTTVPDNIPITATPTIKLTPPTKSSSITESQKEKEVEKLDTSSTLISTTTTPSTSSSSKINNTTSTPNSIVVPSANSLKPFVSSDQESSSDHPSSITELEEEDDIHHSEVSSDADHTDHHFDHDVDQKHLDWTNQLNPNDIDSTRLMITPITNDGPSIKEINHHHHLNHHLNVNDERSLILNRQRSDSISILPSLEEKLPSFSEIRRVNSEQALHQTTEESLLWEANQQSRKEFEEFLKSVKDIKDVHNWLKNFSNSASKKIAIVKISRRILDTPHGVEAAAQSLSFMYKFGIYPIVIHGGLNDISKLPISEVVEERYNRSCLLKDAIKKNGVGCTILPPGICKIEPLVSRRSSSSDESNGDLSEEELEFGQSDILPSGGLTMKIDSFDYDIITTALDKGKIPIWDSVAETIDKIEIPINSDITTFELAKRIEPYKIIFACNDGGILDSDHKAIPVVYMSNDYKTLIQAEHTTDRRRVQLKQMKRIVDHLPSSTTVVVTSIESLTHQLLFPRLANGTIIKKREDNKVHIYDSTNYLSIDIDRLRELIENSFGKLLSEDYFDYLKDSLYKLYLCENSDGEYTGCAIVTFKEPDYIPYLCKFCVKKSAQGLGLGDLIWRVLQRDNGKLYWRSRNNNPLNPWYFQRCQGSFRADEAFTIFWYGDDKFEDGSFLIEEALRKPISILPNPTVA